MYGAAVLRVPYPAGWPTLARRAGSNLILPDYAAWLVELKATNSKSECMAAIFTLRTVTN
jgi:hypothetical protein